MKRPLEGAVAVPTINGYDSSKICDDATDQTHTSQQIIIDKYKSLMRMQNNVVDMKRGFNERIIALSVQQEHLCTILSDKIQEFNRIQAEDELNTDNKLSVTYKQQNILEYKNDGFRLKVIELPIVDLIDLRHKQEFIAGDDIMCRLSSERRLRKAIIQNDIETIYQQFDGEISSLSHYQAEVQLELKLMELHCLTIYREVLILDHFEEPEKVLHETVAALSSQMMRIEEDIKCNKSKLKCVFELSSTPEASTKNFNGLRRFSNITGKTLT